MECSLYVKYQRYRILYCYYIIRNITLIVIKAEVLVGQNKKIVTGLAKLLKI